MSATHMELVSGPDAVRFRRQEQRELLLRTYFARPAAHIAEIGQLLIETRDDLPPGAFLSWLAATFPACCTASAYDYMMVSETLADFPRVDSISAGTLFAMARGSTPEELRHYVIRRSCPAQEDRR